MKIIEDKYRGKDKEYICDFCESIFTFNRIDLLYYAGDLIYDFSPYYYIHCPCCKRTIIFNEKPF